ncbi:MAG: GDP-mannose 4,6-dehydratase [Leptospirales bacterium]
MKKILIFGTGFIANALIQHINSVYTGTKISVIYNKTRIKGENAEGITQYSLDDNLKNVLSIEKPSYIVCLYGISFVPSNIDPMESIDKNVLTTLNFLEIIYQTGYAENLEKILIIGSASEYGKFYKEAISEDFKLHPTSLYGLSKIFLYNTALYYKERGLPIVYGRQYNTIGVDQRDVFALPSFARQVAKIEKGLQEPIMDVGDLTQERDLLDVRDTVLAYTLLLKKGEIGEVYNIASGNYTSMENVVNILLEQSSIAMADIKIESNVKKFSENNSLSKRLWGDISKLRSLGFKPKYTLKETTLDILNYWRANV